MHDVTENEISIAIENLKLNSAPGIDVIPPKFVKNGENVIDSFINQIIYR